MESSPLPKLTVLLGAGSTIHAGVPSTQSLTETVCKLKFPMAVFPTAGILYEPDTRPIRLPTEVESIIPWSWRKLKGSFKSPDFEGLLHLAEEMESFSFSRTNSEMLDEFRHVLASALDLYPSDWFLNQPNLFGAARKAAINHIITSIARALRINPRECHLKDLFDSLRRRFALSVFTLNYDDLVDSALDTYFDGFVKPLSDVDALSFDKIEFTKRATTENLVLAHLHGSVRFGYGASQIIDLAKFSNRDAAIDSFGGRAPFGYNDHGSNVSPAPIISGYNKTSKLNLNPVPFGYYYRAFVDSIIISPRILVIGYGSGDEHINKWLNEFKDIHADDRRVVWVTKFRSKHSDENRQDTKGFSMLAGADGVENCLRMIDAPIEASAESVISCGRTSSRCAVRISIH